MEQMDRETLERNTYGEVYNEIQPIWTQEMRNGTELDMGTVTWNTDKKPGTKHIWNGTDGQGNNETGNKWTEGQWNGKQVSQRTVK